MRSLTIIRSTVVLTVTLILAFGQRSFRRYTLSVSRPCPLSVFPLRVAEFQRVSAYVVPLEDGYQSVAEYRRHDGNSLATVMLATGQAGKHLPTCLDASGESPFWRGTALLRLGRSTGPFELATYDAGDHDEFFAGTRCWRSGCEVDPHSWRRRFTSALTGPALSVSVALNDIPFGAKPPLSGPPAGALASVSAFTSSLDLGHLRSLCGLE